MNYLQRKVKLGSVYDYTVEGSFDFPLDMLRYDQAWPRDEGPISEAVSRYSQLEPGRRRVRLSGLRPPTDGRWESFGWRVVAEGSHG